jgi:hypothetical protein
LIQAGESREEEVEIRANRPEIHGMSGGEIKPPSF